MHCLDLPSFKQKKKQLQIYRIIYFIEYSVLYIKKTIVIIIFKSKLARSRHYNDGINKIKKKTHSKYRLTEVKVNLILKIV